LDESDVFFDENVGNISIDKVEVRTYVDAARTVVSGTTPETLWYWDQSTGVLVEAWSEYPEFTLTTIATKTGLWAPQIFGLEYPVFYALIIVSVAIAAIILVLIFRRKKGQLHQRNQRSLVEAGDPSS
jgi:hypothetical protein